MTGPISIDTPDYQRGLVSAQKLLATVPAGTDFVVVGVPPNAESVVVAGSPGTTALGAAVAGVTSGIVYSGALLTGTNVSGVTPQWVFDVSSVVDEQIQVTCFTDPQQQWFVYADAGVHLTVDTSKLGNTLGQQYVIPAVPSNLSRDHPPVELQVASLLDAPNGTGLVPPPVPGARIRVFDAFVNGTSTAAFVALRTSVTGMQIIGLGTTTANTAGRIDCRPSGVPLPGNQGINIVTTAGNGDGTVVYTVETI